MNNFNALCFRFLIVFVLVKLQDFFGKGGEISSVSAIKCYSCIGCNDPFDESNAKTATCAGSCLKTKTGGNVIRACSPSSFGDKCDSKDGIEACSCTNNLCNGASGMSFPVVGLCLSLFTMFLWVK